MCCCQEFSSPGSENAPVYRVPGVYIRMDAMSADKFRARKMGQTGPCQDAMLYKNRHSYWARVISNNLQSAQALVILIPLHAPHNALDN
jgi:hypothetical protein